MKKLILILALMTPILVMGQKGIVDSLTVEKDTIVRYAITNPNYLAGLIMYADTLEGTLDGTVKLVVANDFRKSGIPSPASTIPDSLFILLDPSFIDTLSAVGPRGFRAEPLPFDYFGFQFTKGNITKWHIKWEMKIKERK